MRLWKIVGLATLAGVVAAGVAVERRRRTYRLERPVAARQTRIGRGIGRFRRTRRGMRRAERNPLFEVRDGRRRQLRFVGRHFQTALVPQCL